jgi:hypothetical protein
MNVIAIKLISGEELVGDGEIVECDKLVRMKEPVMFVPVSEHQTACMPFMPISKQRLFEFKFEHIICITKELAIEMVNFYNQKYGNGIVLANSTVDIKNFKVAA